MSPFPSAFSNRLDNFLPFSLQFTIVVCNWKSLKFVVWEWVKTYCSERRLTLSKTTKFILLQTERSADADDNFEFDDIGKKLSNREENTMEKGEIACYD